MKTGQKYPPGLSHLACHYLQFKDADIFPSYQWSTVRLIFHRALRVAFLERKLLEYDQSHTAHLKGLTENQKRSPGQAPVQDELETLMNDLQEAKLSYSKTSLAQSQYHQDLG